MKAYLKENLLQPQGADVADLLEEEGLTKFCLGEDSYQKLVLI